MNQSGVQSMTLFRNGRPQKLITTDGYHHLFVTTTSGVTETYWIPGNASAPPTTWQVSSCAGTVGATTDQEVNGTFQTYTATTSGVYETYWTPGTVSLNTGLLVSLSGVTGIVKDIEASGVNQLYTAAAGGTYESYWTPGAPGVTTG
ncbi:MAG TPA: hypothetical protein VHX38_17310, partial [Pseudonocardiaceae bacterium]|nr:hypothetical protein [Pseudonocardiaceae bacterium]